MWTEYDQPARITMARSIHMDRSFVREHFPDLEEEIRDLVRSHANLEDEQLLLAICYNPRRAANRDVFIFEVTDNFGSNTIDPDQDFFEVAFGSTADMPLPPGLQL